MVVRRAQLATNPGHHLEREMSKLGRIICIVERAVSEGKTQGCEKLSLLPKRAP